MTSGEINNWLERFTVRAAIQKKNGHRYWSSADRRREKNGGAHSHF
jgi:hypothetical protein